MNRDGWRLLVRGLSVVAGAVALAGSLYWVVIANVLESYLTNAVAAWTFAVLSAFIGIALCAWPWLLWKPTKLNNKA